MHSFLFHTLVLLIATLNKIMHGISVSCKASKSLTRRWSRSKAPVSSHPIPPHPCLTVCAWDHSPVPGGREKTEEFTTQEHMGTHNVRSQEKQQCDYACNHGTGLIFKQDVRKNAKEFVFFPKASQASPNNQLLHFWLLQVLKCLSLPTAAATARCGSKELIALTTL